MGGEVSRRRPYVGKRAEHLPAGKNKVSHYVLLFLSRFLAVLLVQYCAYIGLNFLLFPSDVGGNSIYSSFPRFSLMYTYPRIPVFNFPGYSAKTMLVAALATHVFLESRPMPIQEPFLLPSLPTTNIRRKRAKGCALEEEEEEEKAVLGKGPSSLLPSIGGRAGVGGEGGRGGNPYKAPFPPSLLIAVCCYIHMGLDGMGLLQSGIGTYVRICARRDKIRLERG